MVVVGAGASGLSVAAVLARRGRNAIVLERDESVGATWARRYERLCLHTTRRFSGLPFHPLPRSHPRYIPKDLYARYLASYVEQARLDVRLGTRVDRVRADAGGWCVEIAGQSLETDVLVVATGRHSVPRLPDWPGAGDYGGRLLHSQDYATGAEFAGSQALVVGIGNSGAEIAVDLVEQGAAAVSVAVRSRPPITSREIAGIPVQLFGMALHPFSASLVDRLGKAMRRRATGDLTPYGLGEEQWGPFAERRPPVIDVGFLRELKAGAIKVLPAVVSFTPEGVVTADGREYAFHAVVAATGFTTGLEQLVDAPEALDERGYPLAEHPVPGLFFAGYSETPRGQLFEANRGARRLAARIDEYLAKLILTSRDAAKSLPPPD